MKNADLPAMPLPLGHETSEGDQGLTKFEHAVIEAMKGLASNPNIVTEMGSTDPEKIGEYAINIAIGTFSILEGLDK